MLYRKITFAANGGLPIFVAETRKDTFNRAAEIHPPGTDRGSSKNTTIMKALRLMMAAVMISLATAASAMSYRQARKQALFLTDKMAYELQLTDQQYEAAYEINLDYMMAVSHADDLYGSYWARRNADLRYVLANWQYALYTAASYFYRPFYWRSNAWYFPVYSHYTDRSYYYYPRPSVYYSYRGGFHNGNHRYYEIRTWNRPARQKVVVVRDKHYYDRPYNTRHRRYDYNGNAFGKGKDRNSYDYDRAFGNGRKHKTDNRRNAFGHEKQMDRRYNSFERDNRSFGSNSKGYGSRSFGNSSDGIRAKKVNYDNDGNPFGGHR